MDPSNKIIVVDYSTNWALEFRKLKCQLEAILKGFIINILHIGSTSVEGLAAKPIIDIVIIINNSEFERVKLKLATLGYFHNGDQGIVGREAFKLPKNLKLKLFPHHLYVCDSKADELQRYYAFLRYLRENHKVKNEYSQIKKEAARRHPYSIENYMDYKGRFIAKHLTNALNLRGYKPNQSNPTCPKCESQLISTKISIHYQKAGANTEILHCSCQNCEYSWDINTI